MDGSMTDGNFMGMDFKRMIEMLGPAVQQRLSQMPPKARQALRETEVYITQQGVQINVNIRFREGDENAEKVKGILMESLMGSMPLVIKMVGSRAFVKKIKEE